VNQDPNAAFEQELIFHHLDENNSTAARQVFRLVREGEQPPRGPATAGAQAADRGGAITSSDGSTQAQRADAPEFYKVRWLGRIKESSNAEGRA